MSLSPPHASEASGGEGSGVGGELVDGLRKIPPTLVRIAGAMLTIPPHRYAGGGEAKAALRRQVGHRQSSAAAAAESGIR
jgi:hypothetical protein